MRCPWELPVIGPEVSQSEVGEGAVRRERRVLAVSYKAVQLLTAREGDDVVPDADARAVVLDVDPALSSRCRRRCCWRR